MFGNFDHFDSYFWPHWGEKKMHQSMMARPKQEINFSSKMQL